MKTQDKTRINTRNGVLACLAVMTLGLAQAQPCSVKRVGTTPLVKDGSHFLMPATVNGAPVHFLVDTGAVTSSIDAKVAAQLALPSLPGRTTQLIGTDGGRGKRVPKVSIWTLGFGGLAHGAVELAAPDRPDQAGPLTQGIIGADVLSRYDLEFDFSGRQLNLYTVDGCDAGSAQFQPWQQPYDTVNLKIAEAKGFEHIASLPITVDNQALEMALDTGATRTKVMLGAAVKLGLDEEQLKAQSPKSTSHSSSGVAMANYARRFDSIQIGQSSYRNVELKFSEIDVKPYDGLLGLDFLGSRKIWISYATRQLFIDKPEHQSMKR